MFKFIIYFFIFLIFSKPSYAYLDPGIASFIIQSIVGSIAVGLGFISMYWSKFKSLFFKNEKKLDKKNKRKGN